MKCKKCGEELPDRARFCLSCGTPVEDIPATKRLEEPLDPMDAGAVPLVPVAPPPRATRVTPRAPRSQAYRGSESGARRVASVSYQPYPSEAVPDDEMEDERSFEDTSAQQAVRPKRRSQLSRAAAHVRIALRRLRRRAAAYQPHPSIITVFCVLLGAALLAFVVYSSTSWFGPFALRPSSQTSTDGGSTDVTTSEDSADDSDDAEGGNSEGLVVRSAVEDYSWDELSQLADLISRAQSDSAGLEVAKTFNLCASDGTLDGTQMKTLGLADGTEVTMRIVGFRQDEKSDGSGVAGITMLAETSVANRSMCENYQVSAGWAGSSLRAWMNDELLAELPDEVSSVVVSVDKKANAAPGTGGSQGVTSDTLWVPSYSEIVGELTGGNKRYGIYEQEGAQYQLFADAGVDWSSANSLLACSDYWWLRTPDPSNSSWFMCVTPDGLPTYGHRPATENAVLMGFCL